MVKECLKDWRVLLYTFLIIASSLYLGFLFTQKKVVIVRSNVLPEGITIYKINDCVVKSVSDFYSCITMCKNDTNVTVFTSGHTYLVNCSSLKNTTVRESTGIHFGIDIIGGVRVVLEPEKNISYQELEIAAKVIEKRINPQGLKQVSVKTSVAPSGKEYIIVEFPESELSLLDRLKKQGKFEAKIDNITVFNGSDIKYIYTDPQHAGIQMCYPVNHEGRRMYVCKYAFAIVLSERAARNFANATKNLSIVYQPDGLFLSKTIDFYLDGKKVESLRIAADLKGKVVQDVMISGTALGYTQEDAYKNALKAMRDLQVILASGSLPVKFKIVRIDKISPMIGEIILHSVIFVGVLSFLGVALLVFLTYRNVKASLLIIFNILVEILLVFAAGVALGQTIDIPALAGILIAIGTGVDDQVIAINEILRGKKELDLEKKISKVNFVIISSVLTITIAMLPLLSLGLGLFKGFAIMTILGALIGAFITRPAFIKLAESVL